MNICYALFANDERGIRSLFNDAVLFYFESNPGRCIEAGGNQIFLYQDQVVLPPQSMANFVNEGLKTINLFEGTQYHAR